MGADVDGLGLFAMQLGSVANPVVGRYIMPLAGQHGRKLSEAAIPENGQVLAGKKTPSDKMLEHVAETATKKSVKTSAPKSSGQSLVAFRMRTGVRRPDGRQMGGRSGPAEERQCNSKTTEHFNSISGRINNDSHTNHFQIESRQERLVRYSVWNSVCLIVKPQRQQRKRAINLTYQQQQQQGLSLIVRWKLRALPLTAL